MKRDWRTWVLVAAALGVAGVVAYELKLKADRAVRRRIARHDPLDEDHDGVPDPNCAECRGECEECRTPNYTKDPWDER